MQHTMILAAHASPVVIHQQQNIWTVSDPSDEDHGKQYGTDWKFHPVSGKAMGYVTGVFPRTVTLRQLHEDVVRFVRRGNSGVKSTHSELRVEYPDHVYKIKVPTLLDSGESDQDTLPIRALGCSIPFELLSNAVDTDAVLYADYYTIVRGLGFDVKTVIRSC